MKEISLKREPEKKGKETAIAEPMQPSYPSFSMYDKAPLELLKIPIGTELTAKVKLTSKDIHEGEKGRQSVGFDCISIMAAENTDTARAKGKEIADTIIKPKKGGE